MRLVWRELDRNSKRDLKLVERICRESGSVHCRNELAFMRACLFRTSSKPKDLWCEILNDCAFYMCVRCKKHVRGVFTCVLEKFHGKGLGRLLCERCFARMKANGIDTFKFRTSQHEDAFKFWTRMGAHIVGVNGDDFEMEMKINLDKGDANDTK